MFAVSDIDHVSRVLRTEAAEIATLSEVERAAASHSLAKITDDLAQVISLSSRAAFDRETFHRVSGLTREEDGSWGVEPAPPRTVRFVLSGSPVHCDECGCGLFYHMTRSRDYETLKCTECGTLRQNLTESGASA